MNAIEQKVQDLRQKLSRIQQAKAVAESELKQATADIESIKAQCTQLGFATPELAEASLQTQLAQLAQQIEHYAALI